MLKSWSSKATTIITDYTVHVLLRTCHCKNGRIIPSAHQLTRILPAVSQTKVLHYQVVLSLYLVLIRVQIHWPVGPPSTKRLTRESMGLEYGTVVPMDVPLPPYQTVLVTHAFHTTVQHDVWSHSGYDVTGWSDHTGVSSRPL